MLREIRGDLFDSQNSSLAHCVSRDLRMGKGIAVAFKERFGRIADLKAQKRGIGDVAVLECDADRAEDGLYAYYLITKEKYSDKPTYDSLRSSLEAMKAHAVAHNIELISMPKIGCGLDKLDWNHVRSLIKEVFADTDVRIDVYYL
eukprot:TRINITY_DN7201_c0_g1_i1.p1 TRINITY_DN7201_c0_g1~~TRINITY_DN7201_c0_g1_i1.p1  ORF type:complete len:146 (+),score=18.15 TRINITY_DN7201_c0_g1_i1:120-557(+)